MRHRFAKGHTTNVGRKRPDNVLRGVPSFMGMKHSQKTIEKMSTAHKGDKTGVWIKGKVSYPTIHRWVETVLGKPRECSHCKSTNKKTYDWANKNHVSKLTVGKQRIFERDITQWIRLCRSCHSKYDLCKLR